MALTDKQRRFIEEYCGDAKFNGSEAARRAGYTGNTNTINVAASRLLASEHIAQGVAERMAELAERCAITLETISQQLQEDRMLAHRVDQAGAAVSASMGLAKLHGLITDKQEMTGKNGAPLIPTAIEIVHVKAGTKDQGGTS